MCIRDRDISCLGKCSLTVALPIISAMGVETCVVPTAVAYTHLDVYKRQTYNGSVVPMF